MTDFQLTVLGCGSALPAKGRMPSSQYLSVGKYNFLIDCGEGTQHLIRKYRLKLQGITHIFITHMHGDHFLGLMGLLFSMTLLGREKPVMIIGPAELEELIQMHLKHAKAGLKFPIEYRHTQAEKKETVLDLPNVSVSTLPLDHKIATTGFFFEEKPGPRKLIAKKLEYYQVPIKQRAGLTRGDDFVTEAGERIPNSRLTEDPRPAVSYAYCSDTAYRPALMEEIKGCDVLYHESTFMEADRERAKRTRHSTASDAARIAAGAGVRLLLLGHYSARYEELDGILQEAQAVFPKARLGQEGLQIDFHHDL